MIGKYCIVRTYSAGVFAGVLKSMEDKTGTVADARRIWYWAGAASLSELAVRGTALPGECKFPVAVSEVLLTEIIEVIPCSAEAEASIKLVPEWTAH
jgi:hypothetical protein